MHACEAWLIKGVAVENSASSVTIAEIEHALSEVSEIKAARVVASPEGLIQEIHVLALPSKSPKQLVRDIESSIMARFGIPVDHRKISIAQLGTEVVPIETARPEVRAKILSINTDISGVQAKAVVTLELEGEVYLGEASGPASVTGRQRLVATATLSAVEQYMQGSFGFALEDVGVIQLGKERVAVSCFVLVTALGEQPFAGSALVRQNEKDSIVRATLDAINRRLGFLITT